MKLLEIKKPKQPALPPAKPEDIEAVREAVGFLFAVQKRLEKMDELYADTEDFGGIGIYHHDISFRWFGGGGEAIPRNDQRAIRQIIKEERAKRKNLKLHLSDKVEMEVGEGTISVPWLPEMGPGCAEWDAAWAAAGMKHVDYPDMVKDLHALAESHKFVSDEDADQVEFELNLLKKHLEKQLPGCDITVGKHTNGGDLHLVYNLKMFFICHPLSEVGKIMKVPLDHYRVCWYVNKKPREKTFSSIEDVVAHIKKVAT
jgi:hypothetical protein